MLIQLCRAYSLKLVFVLSLLLGIQLPNFLQQYETRLDAHLVEAEKQLDRYQALADLFFSGDIDALITKHKASSISLFEAEALIIEDLVSRVSYLQSQQSLLQGPLISRLYILLGEFNQPLFLETEDNYNAEIVLNKDALTVGILLSLFITLAVELLFLSLGQMLKRQHIQSKLK